MKTIEIRDKHLIYKPNYTSDFIKKTIEDKKLDGLWVLDHPDFDINNLYFLKELYFLEKLYISIFGNENINFSFLLDLINLKSIGIHIYKKKTTINLTNNQNLELFSFEYFDKNTTIIGLENCLKLKTLLLSEYHHDTLENLGKLKSLKKLTIKSSKLRSLKGIENFINLEYLYIGGIRRLKSISAINEMPSLKKVTIDGCRQINDFDMLTNIPNLEMMVIQDNGNMDYAPFLEKLAKTKKLKIGYKTKIKNIEITLSKEEQELKDKKHKENLKRNREIFKSMGF